MADDTTRHRIARQLIVDGWSGAGQVSQEILDHASLAQHMLYVALDSKPSAGILKVEGRPTGGTKFVGLSPTLIALDMTPGSVALPFIGYFDAIRLSFTTALAGGGLASVWVHSSGDDLNVGST
jgi:hypothetical protein